MLTHCLGSKTTSRRMPSSLLVRPLALALMTDPIAGCLWLQGPVEEEEEEEEEDFCQDSQAS